jgi:hypothetical protein
LIEEDKEKSLFFQCLPHWNVVALDSHGRSEGLLTGWNPSFTEFCSFGIMQVSLWKEYLNNQDSVKLLNCYAPYKDGDSFWNQLLVSRLLGEENLIIVGDLNFTLSAREIWGDQAQIDPMADFFSNLLQSIGLIDLHPSVMSPTWWNGRSGSLGISKRLDHFLLASNLLETQYNYRSWVFASTISDHNLICLQVDGHSRNVTPPFKFNSTWLDDPDFNSLVRSTWNEMHNWTDSSSILLLCDKLKHLKRSVIKWNNS